MTAAAISVIWIVFGTVWLIASLRTKRTRQRAPLGSRLRYVAPLLTGSYLLFMKNIRVGWARAHVAPANPVIEIVALCLTVLGIGLAIWARFYIGSNWSSAVTVKVEHELIRTGPYAWVRHPIYAGLLVALLGTALEQNRWTSLLALALFWLGFWIKSRMEEEFMRQTFGAEYVEYCRSTGALTPKLWS